jgi:hypothetical protein
VAQGAVVIFFRGKSGKILFAIQILLIHTLPPTNGNGEKSKSDPADCVPLDDQ